MKSIIKRLSFINFDLNKKFFKNLKSIYGIGNFYAKENILRLGYSKSNFLNIINVDSILYSRLFKFIKTFIKSYNFRFKKLQNLVMNRIKLKTIKGVYLKLGYPLRNQRKRTNAKTARRLNKILYLTLKAKK